jgi:hypothetical protein
VQEEHVGLSQYWQMVGLFSRIEDNDFDKEGLNAGLFSEPLPFVK